MASDPDLCARCRNQFPAGQVCDRCKAAPGAVRAVLAWLGQLATMTLAWMIAFWVVHLLGIPWPA